jgi:hypothetical protein
VREKCTSWDLQCLSAIPFVSISTCWAWPTNYLVVSGHLHPPGRTCVSRRRLPCLIHNIPFPSTAHLHPTKLELPLTTPSLFHVTSSHRRFNFKSQRNSYEMPRFSFNVLLTILVLFLAIYLLDCKKAFIKQQYTTLTNQHRFSSRFRARRTESEKTQSQRARSRNMDHAP